MMRQQNNGHCVVAAPLAESQLWRASAPLSETFWLSPFTSSSPNGLNADAKSS